MSTSHLDRLLSGIQPCVENSRNVAVQSKRGNASAGSGATSEDKSISKIAKAFFAATTKPSHDDDDILPQVNR